ncbi:hypothetical protein [Terrarubrum flagellatum]|uniref:hypothetical protein n=1 Tax=Terrirubrum flagellatum TaxID=2895980 RepID=UPI003144FD56
MIRSFLRNAAEIAALTAFVWAISTLGGGEDLRRRCFNGDEQSCAVLHEAHRLACQDEPEHEDCAAFRAE